MYVESGSLTTDVAGPGGVVVLSSGAASGFTSKPASSSPTTLQTNRVKASTTIRFTTDQASITTSSAVLAQQAQLLLNTGSVEARATQVRLLVRPV